MSGSGHRDLSVSVTVPLACVCGAAELQERWELVDGRARRDLVAGVASGALLSDTCPACGRAGERRDPLLVLCVAGGFDVLLVFTPDGSPPVELPAATASRWAELARTPEVINLPFEAAAIVAPRDYDADLTDPETAVREVTREFGGDNGERYAAVLGMLSRLDRKPVLDALTDDLLNALADTDDPAALERFVAARPESLEDETLAHLTDMARHPALAPMAVALVQALHAARTDPAGASRDLHATVTQATVNGETIASDVDRAGSLVDSGHWDDAIELIDRLLRSLHANGQTIIAGMLHRQMGKALLATTSGNRAQNVDAAVHHYTEAMATTAPGEDRAAVASNLAAAWVQRNNDDPAENYEQAVTILEQALRAAGDALSDELAAYLHHNLARTLYVREHGSRPENLRNARRHCDAALALRTPEGDREEWADSELVLSDILQGLVRLGEATPAEAESASQRILENADLFDSGYPVARVQAGLADTQLTEAAIAEQEGDDHRRVRALAAAEEHIRRGMAAIDGEDDQRPLLGRLLARRAEVFDGLGHPDAAIEAGTRALEILRPESDARECRQAAFTLGSLLAKRRDWPAARAAFEDGLRAASLAFHARLDTAKREQELERRGNLHRWAAFAIARSGDLERAAEVLEDGRAHELRRRLEPGEGDDALAGLPDALAGSYRRARAALAAAPLGDPSIAPSRALQEALAAIRRQPGLSDFGMATTLAQVGSAARPSVPLIFVNPTPFGTLLLAVCDDGHGPKVRAEFAETPSSHAVMERMMFGDLSSTDPVSFVLHATGLAFDEDGEPIDRMADALDQLLPWLGEHVARPLGHLLSDLGAAGATVVPCGLIALAPLHAAPWTADGTLVCLLDRYEVSFAPSATVHAGCLQRAAIDRGHPRLVAVGDPVVEPRLEAARAEVAEIAEHFAYAEVAVDSEATSGFVLGRAAGATHVHLACHGEGGVDDFEQTRIHLTDRPVTASELAASKVLDARLTVASACQTAISEQVRFPDEALSLGTALVAGGSACVIASLWAVCDLATALLMTRLYDELLNGDVGEPVQALRRAQLWLRDLSGDAEQHFLDEHPSLAAEFRRRRSRGEVPGARSNRQATGAGLSPAAGPYAHPDLWAAFVALGA